VRAIQAVIDEAVKKLAAYYTRIKKPENGITEE
jgi:hypothetical protein